MFVPEFQSRSSFAGRWAASDTSPLRAAAPSAGAFRAEFAQLQREIAATVTQGFANGGDDEWVAARPALLQLGLNAIDEIASGTAARPTADKQAFLEGILPFAREAGAALGVSEDLVAAHAALESGWGRRPLTNGAGADSYNLFGLKAGAGWSGGVADVLTTEFVGGSPLKTVERFRAYPDYRAAFADYVALLRGNPRFRGVVGTGGDAAAFASALANGGYATDPAYASKLRSVAADVAGVRGAGGVVISAQSRALADPAARRFPGR